VVDLYRRHSLDVGMSRFYFTLEALPEPSGQHIAGATPLCPLSLDSAKPSAPPVGGLFASLLPPPPDQPTATPRFILEAAGSGGDGGRGREVAFRIFTYLLHDRFFDLP
jgi:hypothetical protein